MRKIKQYLSYILFAIISTILNLLIQIIVEGFLLYFDIEFLYEKVYKDITVLVLFKMLVATIGAFVFKYFVDKTIVFKDKTRDIKENIKQINLYTFFAVFTTLIFWSTELLFKQLLAYRYSEYIGAVVGLAIGYTIKFFLDRKFVFNV